MVATRDVARLYGYETKRINEIVKRNIDRFPSDFCFQLTKNEINKVFSLRSQFATLKNGRGEHRKYLPYVFKEYHYDIYNDIMKISDSVENYKENKRKILKSIK